MDSYWALAIQMWLALRKGLGHSPAEGLSAVFPDQRFFDPPMQSAKRRGWPMGHAGSAGRRKGVQEAFADEITDEMRRHRETEPPGQ